MKANNKGNYILLLVTIIFTIIGCKNSVTDPIIVKEVEPGRRDYVWTVDTLNTPGGAIKAIWGSSIKDIWAAGNSIYEPNSDIWHYDGNTWSKYTDLDHWWSPTSLFGFSADDIWMGNDLGQLWHYDGNNWQVRYAFDFIQSPINISNVEFSSICNISSSEMYACASGFISDPKDQIRSMIYFYNGNEWKQVYINNESTEYLAIREYNKKLYILGYYISPNNINEQKHKIFEYSGGTMKEIYCDLVTPNSTCYFEKINNILYFNINNTIKKYDNNEFATFLDYIYSGETDSFWGRTSKDIFFFMNSGILHYNGTDYQKIYEVSALQIDFWANPAIFEKDIFILGRQRENGKCLIIHGQLPN